MGRNEFPSDAVSCLFALSLVVAKIDEKEYHQAKLIWESPDVVQLTRVLSMEIEPILAKEIR